MGITKLQAAKFYTWAQEQISAVIYEGVRWLMFMGCTREETYDIMHITQEQYEDARDVVLNGSGGHRCPERLTDDYMRLENGQWVVRHREPVILPWDCDKETEM